MIVGGRWGVNAGSISPPFSCMGVVFMVSALRTALVEDGIFLLSLVVHRRAIIDRLLKWGRFRRFASLFRLRAVWG